MLGAEEKGKEYQCSPSSPLVILTCCVRYFHFISTTRFTLVIISPSDLAVNGPISSTLMSSIAFLFVSFPNPTSPDSHPHIITTQQSLYSILSVSSVTSTENFFFLRA